MVELDGSQHYETAGRQHDQERDAYLEGLGLRVLRFSNRDVDQHFTAVCEMIERAIAERSGI